MKMLVVFEKRERLRHIGHLDLMRAMQRALRRSDLPVRYSQGFNPHMLLSFAAPLSVGMPGTREMMEVPLEKPIGRQVFMARLGEALPPDLHIVDVIRTEDSHKPLMALLEAACFEAKMAEVPEGFAEKVDAFLRQDAIPAIRKTKTGDKPCDIRPMIYQLMLDGDKLKMTLALCEKATCKPELLLQTLFDFAGVPRPRMLVTRTLLLGKKDDQFVPLETL